MPDRHLKNGRDSQKFTEVGKIQIVTRIEAQTKLRSTQRRRAILLENGVLRLTPECLRVAFGVKLDSVGSYTRHSLDHLDIGVEEDTAANIGIAKPT